ncbi:MAG: heavy metal-responsive transcriptional regulator [Microcoleaceae cyanobacterium]
MNITYLQVPPDPNSRNYLPDNTRLNKVGMIRTITQGLKIGDVAALTGFSVKTVRYYESIGLLTPTVERSQAGYRLFHPLVLNRLAFVRRAKSLGLSLDEIREILIIRDRGDLPCDQVKQRLNTKIEAITQQIEALEGLRLELQDLVNHWQDHPSSHKAAQTICPNLQT